MSNVIFAFRDEKIKSWKVLCLATCCMSRETCGTCVKVYYWPFLYNYFTYFYAFLLTFYIKFTYFTHFSHIFYIFLYFGIIFVNVSPFYWVKFTLILKAGVDNQQLSQGSRFIIDFKEIIFQKTQHIFKVWNNLPSFFSWILIRYFLELIKNAGLLINQWHIFLITGLCLADIRSHSLLHLFINPIFRHFQSVGYF